MEISLPSPQLQFSLNPQNVSTNRTLGKTLEDKTLTKLPIVHGKILISNVANSHVFSHLDSSHLPHPSGII